MISLYTNESWAGIWSKHGRYALEEVGVRSLQVWRSLEVVATGVYIGSVCSRICGVWVSYNLE